LGGVKDVKLLGREEDFLHQYHTHNKGSTYIGQLQATLQAIPRLGLELLAVLGLALLVFVMIGQGQSLDALLPTLGLFAAAAFRMLPSVNRVLSAIQSVRFSVPVVDTMYSELRMLELAPSPQRGPPLRLGNTLTLEGVCFQYPSAEAMAIRDVSLSIERGSSVGFVGGSGAGKSTLVDIILGLLTPGSGTVAVDGTDIQSNLRGWQDQVGYVPQTIFLTDDSLRRNIALGLSSETIDEAAVRRALRSAQLAEFVDGLPDGLDTVVGERGIRLSGGQRQRIGIARALYHDPPVLVLDEATSSVDTATEADIMSAVRALRGDKTILIIAHRLSTVEHCDRLFCLDQGRVSTEGEAATVLADLAAVTE
jgi:ABC-type multidrug transport system fused ATPase/permease subunit